MKRLLDNIHKKLETLSDELAPDLVCPLDDSMDMEIRALAHELMSAIEYKKTNLENSI